MILTKPARRNPIPRFPEQWEDEGPAFEPVCEESASCKALAYNCAGNCGFTGGDCKCSGAPKNVEIVDTLSIPADLKPGKCECEQANHPSFFMSMSSSHITRMGISRRCFELEVGLRGDRPGMPPGPVLEAKPTHAPA
eukprot:COSAG01_NODE_774_length_13702_cov_11.108726_18_plen_138_part_00